MRAWLLPALLALPGCAASDWRGFYNERRTEAVPKDVRRFIIATDGCGCFSSEEPYDEDRRADLQRKMDATCTGLDELRSTLLHKHADQPATIRAIEQAWCDEDHCETVAAE